MREASRTALMVAAYRARATARPSPICVDPWAAALAGDDGQAIARAYDEKFAPMELWVAVRTAYIDRLVRDFGGDQIVLLGAGFDARAARLARSGVRFFEVDQPASQENKLARLARLTRDDGYPRDAATYVTCDFEHEDFLDRLRASGFAADRPALFVWEGVTPYLSEAAVRATLRRVATGAEPTSTIVFDYVGKRMVSGDVRAEDLESRGFVADLGEPVRFGIDYPLPLLYEEGFRRVRTLTFDEAALDVTGTYDRARTFRFQGIAIASAQPLLYEY